MIWARTGTKGPPYDEVSTSTGIILEARKCFAVMSLIILQKILADNWDIFLKNSLLAKMLISRCGSENFPAKPVRVKEGIFTTKSRNEHFCQKCIFRKVWFYLRKTTLFEGRRLPAELEIETCSGSFSVLFFEFLFSYCSRTAAMCPIFTSFFCSCLKLFEVLENFEIFDFIAFFSWISLRILWVLEIGEIGLKTGFLACLAS